MSGKQRARKCKRLLAQQGGCCFYCRRALPERFATLDHLRPRSHKGGDADENLVAACAWCNNRRGTMPYMKFMAQVRAMAPHELGDMQGPVIRNRQRELLKTLRVAEWAHKSLKRSFIEQNADWINEEKHFAEVDLGLTLVETP